MNDNRPDISDALKELVSIIRAAGFSNQNSDIDDALLRLVYDEISDRNLALVISVLTGRDADVTLNDVYKIGSLPSSRFHKIEIATQLLLSSGFNEWLERQQ